MARQCTQPKRPRNGAWFKEKAILAEAQMDNPNLTMEEYIRLGEEKARKRGKVFNWQTVTYGKIRVDEVFMILDLWKLNSHL
ncbi:hypothetical protein Tco_0531935 [Tanacetum coccineum]